MPNTALFESSVPGVTALNRGKVRDMYDLGEHLLMVATDRISAHDVVLASAIPDKGKVLTQLSAFWFNDTRTIIPNHMVSTDPATYPEPFRSQSEILRGRSMLVIKTETNPESNASQGGICLAQAGKNTVRLGKFVASNCRAA